MHQKINSAAGLTQISAFSPNALFLFHDPTQGRTLHCRPVSLVSSDLWRTFHDLDTFEKYQSVSYFVECCQFGKPLLLMDGIL